MSAPMANMASAFATCATKPSPIAGIKQCYPIKTRPSDFLIDRLISVGDIFSNCVLDAESTERYLLTCYPLSLG